MHVGQNVWSWAEHSLIHTHTPPTSQYSSCESMVADAHASTQPVSPCAQRSRRPVTKSRVLDDFETLSELDEQRGTPGLSGPHIKEEDAPGGGTSGGELQQVRVDVLACVDVWKWLAWGHVRPVSALRSARHLRACTRVGVAVCYSIGCSHDRLYLNTRRWKCPEPKEINMCVSCFEEGSMRPPFSRLGRSLLLMSNIMKGGIPPAMTRGISRHVS